MRVLYETTLTNEHDIVYTSLNGYTMEREGALYWWVLRDPNGELVDTDSFRLKLCARNGFKLEGSQ